MNAFYIILAACLGVAAFLVLIAVRVRKGEQHDPEAILRRALSAAPAKAFPSAT
jgi:heme/copper-type cytochrome/quinol oxidase subunit 2